MATRIYLENALENIRADLITEWLPSDLTKFSLNKTLYDHQITALQRAIKVLYTYYHQDLNGDKDALYQLCLGEGLKPDLFSEHQFKNNRPSERFERLQDFYGVKTFHGEALIPADNFFNRAAFWMATASGKTLVLIKLIEIMDELITKSLIPRQEFMVLFPDEKIEKQFAETVAEYNIAKEKPIRALSLKKYENAKNSFALFNEIKVYTYRSDLLSDEEKTRRINTKAYDNGGKWYVFMDEAHKGDKENSVIQDYVTKLSRNGFLFNFSATFTDPLDYATTCYNFNLERFIEKGYGKNIYLTLGKFSFNRNLREDFNQVEKQVQVLKSLITFTLIKQSKEAGFYHDPLLVTLVNTVQDDESDLVLFFKVIEEIAENKVAPAVFAQAKEELKNEFSINHQYQFGNDVFGDYAKDIEVMTPLDIFKNVFNTRAAGKFEIIEGEKGSEFALKLQTATKPFALIRIGEAREFINKNLKAYIKQSNYSDKSFFKNINTTEQGSINLLIGSRMFYEGWDSNRPNVINYINIGSGEAKKYVLQSLGRGVRIEPTPNNRRRLPQNDTHRRQLLETLFVFATNRSAVNTILETLDAQRANELKTPLKENPRLFDLLIPEYIDDLANIQEPAKFVLAKESYLSLKKYFLSFDESLFLLRCGKDITPEEYAKLKELIINNPEKIFKYNPSRIYRNIEDLLKKVIEHVSVKEKSVSGIKALTDEIVHYKYLKLNQDQWQASEIKQFEETITKEISSDDRAKDIERIAHDIIAGKIDPAAGANQISALQVNEKEMVKELQILRLAQHYFSPLIVAAHEKIDYIKHIITVDSERDFIQNLYDFINNNPIDCDWMFAKIDQTIDNLKMPYFDLSDNAYHDFYPDFIFWQKEKNGCRYKITFVDPKGTVHTSYESKVDYFEKLFYKNGKPKVFTYQDYEITFNLRLVNEAQVGGKYKAVWNDPNDFTWLQKI